MIKLMAYCICCTKTVKKDSKIVKKNEDKNDKNIKIPAPENKNKIDLKDSVQLSSLEIKTLENCKKCEKEINSCECPKTKKSFFGSICYFFSCLGKKIKAFFSYIFIKKSHAQDLVKKEEIENKLTENNTKEIIKK